jgi:DNA-binding NarL/FixJ family response regulator
MKKARVLLAEDHVLVAEGLTRLLETDFTLVGTVADGRALVKAVKEHTPDIAIIDISLPLLNGLEAARQIKKSEPHTKLIFLTMHSEANFVRDAFKAGGSGYILKKSATAELVFAIKEVYQGGTYVSPSIAQGLINQALSPSSIHQESHGASPDQLTPRQLEILQLVAEGKCNKDIAVVLSLAVKTVEFHKTRIMQILGLKSTSELTKYAIAHGIISIEPLDPL